MAPFDWLYDLGFEDTIRQQVRSSAAGAGMRSYDTDIADRLIALLRANRDSKVEIEREREVQRTRLDALRSVDFLVREAATVAKSESSFSLTLTHFDVAYQKNYCKFWPFC